MKQLLQAVCGITLWLIGMVFVFLAMRNLVDGLGFWAWLGHLAQGIVIVLIGVALIPNTEIRDFLEQTFYRKR